MADANRLAAALRYQQDMEGPVTMNPNIAEQGRKGRANMAPPTSVMDPRSRDYERRSRETENFLIGADILAGALPFAPLAKGAVMAAGRYATPKVMQGMENYMGRTGMTLNAAPQEEALRLAQQRAALPVEQHGLGLPAGNTPQQRADVMFPESGYHLSRHGADVQSLDSGVFAIAPFDAVGTHIGTKEAMQARWDALGGRHPLDVKGVTYPVRFANQKPMLNADGKPFSEFDLTQNLMNRHNYDNNAVNYRELNAQSRNDIFKDFTSIPYVNDVEAAGSISHIVPPDNIRSRFAAFDPFRRNAALAAALGVAAPDLLAEEK